MRERDGTAGNCPSGNKERARRLRTATTLPAGAGRRGGASTRTRDRLEGGPTGLLE